MGPSHVKLPSFQYPALKLQFRFYDIFSFQMVTRTVLSDLVYTLRVLTASKVAGKKSRK